MYFNATRKSQKLFFYLLVTSFSQLNAAELIVKVESASTDGNIGCSLFSNPKGFPMDSIQATQKFSQNTPTGVEFVFSNLKSGKYAVSVMNDKNGNKTLDKNLLGIPKEEWGVSNNIRPTLRAPSFEEAAIEINEKNDLTLIIRIQK
jgi:uncharacterized protein (DUF2141 family)